MIAALTKLALSSPSWLLLDKAEDIDEQSAAVLAQLASAQHLRLIIATSNFSAIPSALSELTAMQYSHRVDIQPMDYDDAHFLAHQLLQGSVNATTIRALLNVSGGNALYFRELIAESRATGTLLLSHGYWTLHPAWKPTGERITGLVDTRLSGQPREMRATVEKMAITGPMPLPLARLILGAATLDEAIDRGLARTYGGGTWQAALRPSEIVALNQEMAPETVVETLPRARLRSHLEQILSSVDGSELERLDKTSLAVHCLRAGLELPGMELLTTVTNALNARQFSAVLALTNHLESVPEPSNRNIEHLRIARALAHHEAGSPLAAMTALEPLLKEGAYTARLAVAQIHFAAGKVEQALDQLRPREGDPAEVAAMHMVLSCRSHRTVEYDKLLEASRNPDIAFDMRLICLSQYCIELAYRGRATRALELISGKINSEDWVRHSAAAQGHVLHALHPLLLLEGGEHQQLRAMLLQVESDVYAAGHTGSLLAEGSLQLDQGHAQSARVSLAQAIAMAELNDPYSLQGVLAALLGRAAALLGHRAEAQHWLDIARSSPQIQNKSLRPEAERAMLGAIAMLEGREPAREFFDALWEQASARGRLMECLRLRHEEWRLGLVQECDELSSLAATVEGSLASLLAGYARALDTLGPELDDIVQRHVEHGRLLYAAELANEGSERARARGQRARASQLLARCAEIARPLAQVNTPRLGRARIDSAVLSEREYDACTRAARGESNTTIASEMYLSPRTVEGHLQRAYTKLGIRDRRQLIDHTLDEHESSEPEALLPDLSNSAT